MAHKQYQQVTPRIKACLDILFHTLNSLEVPYVVLRNFQRLPNEVAGDIDIIAPPTALDLIEKVFIDAARSVDLSVLKRLRAGRSLVVDTVDLSNNPNGKYNKLEIHVLSLRKYKLAGQDFVLLAEDVIKNSSLNHTSRVRVPHPRDEFVLLLAHWINRQEGTEERYSVRLNELLRVPVVTQHLAISLDLEEIQDLNARILDMRQRSLDVIGAKLLSSVGLGLTSFRYFKLQKMTFEAKLRVFRRFISDSLREKGVVYCFAGPDGAGKSTISREIEKYLVEGVKVDQRVRRFNISHEMYPVTRLLARYYDNIESRIYARKKKKAITHNTDREVKKTKRAKRIFLQNRTNLNKKPAFWRFQRMVGLLVIIIPFIPVWYLKIIPAQIRGDIILMDQSIYEVFFKNFRPRFPWLERVFAPLFPYPDQVVILEAEPDIITNRKPELTKAEIEQYYASIDELLKKTEVSVKRVDSSYNPTALATKLGQDILEHVSSKLSPSEY